MIQQEKRDTRKGDSPMEKQVFERYQKLKMEQKRLSDRVEGLLSEREAIQSRIVIDGVIASDEEYPYIAHISKVEGLESNLDKFENHVINMELKQVRRMQDTTDKALSEIRQMVDEIDDEYIKSIVTYRFINGLSWRQVAFRIGGGNTESAVKMAYKRYIDRQSCDECDD